MRALAVLVCALLIPGQLMAQNYESNASSFAFGDVKFSMSRADFLERFPGAQLGAHMKKDIGQYHYGLVERNSPASSVGVWFCDDEMCEICIVYDSMDKKLSQVGGPGVLQRRLEDTFGRPNDIHNDKQKAIYQALWPFPKADRTVSYHQEIDFVRINVRKNRAAKELQRRLATKENVGF